MRASAITEIITGIEALDADETSKARFRALVYRVGNEHGCKGVERADRIAFASRLLSAKVSRTTVMARLTALHEISKAQAYRDISKALKLSQKTAPFATETNQNKSCDKS